MFLYWAGVIYAFFYGQEVKWIIDYTYWRGDETSLALGMGNGASMIGFLCIKAIVQYQDSNRAILLAGTIN